MKKPNTVQDLELMANTIREDIIEMLTNAASGHSAGPLGMADIFTALYFNVLRHDPRTPQWPDRDRLVLSNGHICPVLYACLARSGYFPITELSTLRQINSRLQGHPHNLSLPGIENSSGPLGQGVSAGVGMALAAKMDNKKLKVFLMMSDGELDEGQSWEAIMFAAKNKLDNIIAIVDRNYIQIDGNTEEVMPLDSLKAKFKAFNWDVVEIDGNNMWKIINTLKEARKHKGSPLIIIARTTPGLSVSFMEGKSEWHGKPPTKEQAAFALSEITGDKREMMDIKCPRCGNQLENCDCIEGY